MIDIYITSWKRFNFLEKTIRLIRERTKPGTFKLHVFDNNSDPMVQGFLISLLQKGELTSVHLESRNTGCLYNKAIFHAMTETDSEYYVVTDNDVYPPRLTPDWLEQMVCLMDEYQELAFLAPQLPPIFLQTPIMGDGRVVFCRAVGNTFKMVRRSAYPFDMYRNKVGEYGDDGLVSRLVYESGWKVAFCNNIFCYHAGQCDDWGYEKKDIDLDPRKSGYGEPFKYEIKNEETYEPLDSSLKY